VREEVQMSADTVRFTAVTPNLIVRDVARSTAFYRDVLGFTVHQTVPDDPPHVFVWLTRGEVTIFLNDPGAVAKDLPSYAAPAFGGTATLFVVVEGVDALHAAVAPHAPIVMSLRTQFYGMREFAIHDPDGHLITFAERVSEK
jgi:catechol 2,3-dioxygenase-like lactoylglutathione lyase family enzyme